MTGNAYRPLRTAEGRTYPVRKLKYHVRIWGDTRKKKVFLLHGWLDTSISFQFQVDEFSEDLCLIAPDWRGYGDSDWAPGGYWMPNLIAGLDHLVDALSPDGHAVVIGHSWGAALASIFSGVRPHKVDQLVKS